MPVNDFKNELVWSHSRARAFEECRRAYWFTYYGSWGGWDEAAAPEVRAAYVEKKLTNRAMWTGTVVHSVAETGLKLGRDGGADDVAAAVAHARARAEEDIAGSASGAWLRRAAKRVGFAEHYYGELPSSEYWRQAVEEIERQVRALLANRIFRRLLDVPERIREVEELQRFPVGDIDVFVSLDVLVDDGRGGVVIIDWKTGDAHEDETIAAQLGVYGLYARDVLGVPGDRIVAMHVNLRHDQEVRHPVGDAEIALAREAIASSAAAMRGALQDVAANVAVREDFPTLPVGDARCGWCRFRRGCGREK